MTIEQIADQINQDKSGLRPVLIAIEGFGGSGKTTFASKLADALGDAYVINFDDFIVKEKLTEPSWDRGAFDHERLEAEVLSPIAAGRSASFRKLTWATNELSSPVTVPDVKYLIIEGVSSYHPKIAHYYRYKIWVDTSIEVARERGRVRDGSSENAAHWGLWEANDLIYRDKYHPEERADFIFQTN